MSLKTFSNTVLACAAAFAVIGATLMPRTSSGGEPSATQSLDQAAFAKLKSLAGEWRGPVGARDSGKECTVVYRITSGGSAVVETLFPGTPHEMVTIYYLDKGRLVLTHYCAMGNQPHMSLAKGSSADNLIFDFAGGTNIKPSRDTYMHNARIQFEGANSILGEWTSYEHGQQGETEKFFLSRKT